MPTARVTYQVVSTGSRQTRKVSSQTGTPGEIADVLAGEHKVPSSDIAIVSVAGVAEPLRAPVTTGNPLPPEVHQAAVERVESAMVEGLHSLSDEAAAIEAATPSKTDINGMKKGQLYDLAATHGVSVDDDPSVADLKTRLIEKLH